MSSRKDKQRRRQQSAGPVAIAPHIEDAARDYASNFPSPYRQQIQTDVAAMMQEAVNLDRGKRPVLNANQAQSLPWGEWAPGTLTNFQAGEITAQGGRVPDRIFVNNVYEVWLTDLPVREGWPAMVWLSIKRRTKNPVRDWRDLQRIKNELVGPENEGVELFPQESRLVDTSNQYHLWVLKDAGLRFPFGYNERLLLDAEAISNGAKQRPFAEPAEVRAALADLRDSGIQIIGSPTAFASRRE